ncbi:MAG: hypothetical protein RMY29_010025 [Nostoc sp. CreGUA01]|nr:hypothetical protein [Nostoc sp. CreGUA01]
MGHGAWDEGHEGEKKNNSSLLTLHFQCPMPHAQCPMPLKS